MNIITIGGSKEFTNYEIASKEIPKILSRRKIKTKDLLVYGYADGLTGAFEVARKWADDNGVKFADGSPKKGQDWNALLAERNTTLAEHSKLLINLRIGSKNGGKGIIEAFQANEVPVELVDIGEAKEDTSTLTPKQKRKGEVPSQEDLERSINIYSKVANKLLNYGCLMLDTETTGLNADDEVIEIALADCYTEVLVFNSLISTKKEIGEPAFRVNGITKEMLVGQPTIGDIWPTVEAIIGNRVLLASNCAFDEKLLNQSLRKHDLDCSFIWQDIQTLYRAYSCQKEASKFPLKTEGMCIQLGITPGTHRAKDDVLAQIKILKAMGNKVVPNFEI